MRKKKKKKYDKVTVLFNGQLVDIVRYDFLAPKTIALSTDLFNEMKRDDK